MHSKGNLKFLDKKTVLLVQSLNNIDSIIKMVNLVTSAHNN
jgi:hypothetical protein